MRRLLWPLGLVLAFGLGGGRGDWPVPWPVVAFQEVAQLLASESRLQSRVSTRRPSCVQAGGLDRGGWMEGKGPLTPCRRGPADEALPGRSHSGRVQVAGLSRAARPLPHQGPRVLASPRDTRVAARRVRLRPRTPRWIASICTSTRRTRREAWTAGSACNNWPTSCGRWARPGPTCSCRSSRREPRVKSGALPLSSWGSCRSSRRCRLLQNIVEQDSDRSFASRGDRGTAPPSNARDRSGPGGVARRFG